MMAAYNNELANELGNAVQRTVSMVSRYLNGKTGKLKPAEHDLTNYNEALNNCQFDRALDEVWNQVRGLNQYIDEEKPWQLSKQGEQDHLKEVLGYQVSSLLLIADLLRPFMPVTSDKISELLLANPMTVPGTTLFPKHEP
jgi:methionyl-tRNA synthetase